MTLFYYNMTVYLCIRQGSKRNDDSVSVEELDSSAESQVLIPAEHLWCDFKCHFKKSILSCPLTSKHICLELFDSFHLYTLLNLKKARWLFHCRKQYYRKRTWSLNLKTSWWISKHSFSLQKILVDYCDVLSAVWTLILMAPIHCRGSIGGEVM